MKKYSIRIGLKSVNADEVMNKTHLGRFCFAPLIIGSLATIAFFQGRLDHYSAVLKKYECNRAVCQADFDGDGVPGKLFIDYDKPLANFDSWFVVEDSGRQLLKQPRRSYDGSLRTHAAIINGPSLRTRLIIYDHIRDGDPPRDLVFAYDGSSKMLQVLPRGIDEEVLAALATTDDAGTKHQWLLFRLAMPVVICCFAALVVLKIVTVKRLSSGKGLS